jgi:hypothetical protein
MGDLADDYAEAPMTCSPGRGDVLGIATGGSLALQLAANRAVVDRGRDTALDGVRRRGHPTRKLTATVLQPDRYAVIRSGTKGTLENLKTA